MLRQHDESLRALLLLVDVTLCAAIFVVSQALVSQAQEQLGPIRGDLGLTSYLALLGLAAFTFPVAIRGLQSQASMRLERVGTIVSQLGVAAVLAVLVMASCAYVLRAPVHPSVLLFSAAGQAAALGLVRITLLVGLRILRRQGRNFRNVLVVGTGPRARNVCETIESHPEWGLRIVAFVDEGDVPLDPIIPEELVHKLIDMPLLLREQVIDEVMVACPRSMLAEIGPVVAACSATGVPITLLTDLFGDYLPPPRVKGFASHAALSFAPVHHGTFGLAVKRSIDIIGALVGLVLVAPVLAVAAIGIRATSDGPVLFRQIRCGLNGRRFEMLKLRTMVVDAEARRAEIESLNEMSGPVFKVHDDPRITPIGRFLRRFSIDEFPQLWNVLVGDMSLVGPRPPIPSEVAQYETGERRRLSMRPGLTCLWQVSGRNALGFDDWVKLDLQYIDGWSLGLDLRIILMTVPTVLRGTGA